MRVATRVFRNKTEGKIKLFLNRVDDRPLYAIKSNKCPIECRVSSFVLQVYEETPKKNTSKNTSGGKSATIPEGTMEITEAERTRLRDEGNLQPIEEKRLDDLGVDLLVPTGANSSTGEVLQRKALPLLLNRDNTHYEI